ncbi:MAG: nucleotidyl transferase AbiEii/AbiGii toxin family protein [Rhodomicrobium sp.]|nr:nucleotidyl transferase AbiEii/AbiGii toxin family protein [Rhodomicrobium sp.]
MIEIIKERLRRYDTSNATSEEHAVKEIMQEVALYALWQADFFDIALFQGGTSLRILHRLPRFSEDLDFLLRDPDSEFRWAPYANAMTQTFARFGLQLDIQAKDKMDRPIREAVLKDDAIARQLDLSFTNGGRVKTMKIKLEIDTNPPAYSGEAASYLDFPADHEVRHQDLPSNFALKIHALLCRPYEKGRDWFDFSWYAGQGVSPNLEHLGAALYQAGRWAGTDEVEQIDMSWLYGALTEKIGGTIWSDAVRDVERFLPPAEQKSLRLWGEDFFKSKLDKVRAIYSPRR